MRHIAKTVALAAFILSPIFGLHAHAEDDVTQSFNLPKYTVQGVNMPEITKMIVPRIPNDLDGQETVMYFTIGKKGEVYNVRSKDRTPGSELPVIMKRALYAWKFTPPTGDQGQPVVIKVALPVRVVPKDERERASYASAFEPMKLELISWVN